MSEQKYYVSLHTPLGRRNGTLLARMNGSALTGTLTILNHTQPFTGEVDERGNCKISGTFITLVRTVPYIATGQISDTALTLDLSGDRNHFKLSGSVCPEEEEPL